MFQFIRKHQAIGLIFIGIVIVSFVIFFSPNQSGGGASMPRGALGSIRGEPIGREDFMAGRKEVRLSFFLRQGGQWPSQADPSWDEEEQVYGRLFLLDEARRLGIRVPDEVVGARIVELPFLSDPQTGGFSRTAYDNFLARIQQEQGITRNDFHEFMRHEIALQQLVQIGGLSGTLMPPSEVESRFLRANEQFGAQLVVLSATNYMDKVDLSAERVSQYYSNRMADYRLPERMQVRYVKFDVTNFLAEADAQLNANTNLAAILDAEYAARDPETFRGDDGSVLTPEAAKEQMIEQTRTALALQAARARATEFANRLYRMEPTAESLSQLAQEYQLEARTTLPFDQFRPPEDLSVPTTFNRQAFALSPDNPFSTPFTGEDGVYLFAFERRIPSEIQPLEIVENRVRESLRRTEARSLAEAAGRELVSRITSAVAQGQSFEAAAAEAGHKVLSVTNLSRDSFSIPEVGSSLIVSEMLRVAEDLEPGQTSDFIPAGDGGFVLHLTRREPPPESLVSAELPDYSRQARHFGRFAAFSEWERHRFAKANVQVPSSRQSQDAAGSTAP